MRNIWGVLLQTLVSVEISYEPLERIWYMRLFLRSKNQEVKDLHNNLYLTFITSKGERTKEDKGDLISVRVDKWICFYCYKVTFVVLEEMYLKCSGSYWAPFETPLRSFETLEEKHVRLPRSFSQEKNLVLLVFKEFDKTCLSSYWDIGMKL